MYQKLGSINLYDFFNNLSVFVLIVFNLFQVRYKKSFLSRFSKSIIDNTKRNKKSILASETFWAIIETLVVSIFQFAPVMALNVKFGELVGTGTNYFGLCFVLPIILMIAFLILGISPLKQMDLITPAFPLTLVTIKFACFCWGCCGGIECSFGLFNNSSGLVEFPVQLVEMGCAAIIFIILMLRKNTAKEGTVFPTYLLLYCSIRFFTEFLRSDSDIIWNLKKYHFLCIAGVVVAVVELFIVKKYRDKILLIYDRTSESMLKVVSKHRSKEKKKIVHHKKRK